MSGYRLSGSYDYNAVCDACGFQYKASQLKKRWDGLMVCEADWETRHSLDFYKTRNDTHKLPFILPDDSKEPYLILGDLASGSTAFSVDPTPVPTFNITATPTSDWTTNNTTEAFTIMAWVNLRYIQFTKIHTIMSTRSATTIGSWGFELGGNGSTLNGCMTMFNQSTFQVRSINGILLPGMWQHMCITADTVANGSGWTTYVNGNPIGHTRTLVPSFIGNSDTVCLGRHNTTSTTRALIGSLKDIRVFNTCRTQQQVIRSMNDYQDFSSTETGLIGWWKLNDNSNILLDSQTNYDPMNFTITDATSVSWGSDER